MQNISQNKISFKETSEVMHQLLRGELTPAEVAKRFDAPLNRVAVYQQFIGNHIRFLLEKNFEVLHGILSEATWDELVKEYFQNYPSADYELNGNAKDFADFLQNKVESEHHELTEFHVELAELEWQEFEAYADTSEIPEPQNISELTLNPTLSILNFNYPTAEFIDAWREANIDTKKHLKLPAQKQEIVFVMRHPKNQLAVFHIATDSLLFAFKLAHDKLDLAKAATQANITKELAEQILNQAAKIGLLIIPDSKQEKPAPTNTNTDCQI